jgi:hypothetical protein
MLLLSQLDKYYCEVSTVFSNFTSKKPVKFLTEKLDNFLTWP